jgi:hypothetical protein
MKLKPYGHRHELNRDEENKTERQETLKAAEKLTTVTEKTMAKHGERKSRENKQNSLEEQRKSARDEKIDSKRG